MVEWALHLISESAVVLLGLVAAILSAAATASWLHVRSKMKIQVSKADGGVTVKNLESKDSAKLARSILEYLGDIDLERRETISNTPKESAEKKPTQGGQA